MMNLSVNYPNLVTLVPIGSSYLKTENQGGHEVQVLKITANSWSSKARLFVLSGLHAREFAPPELVLRFATHLVENFNLDADITTILQNTEIHLLVHANPDGRDLCEARPDLYIRKNIHLDNFVKCDEGWGGVDLNRNFPFMWGLETGSSSDPCADDYQGKGEASEPEVQAIVKYVGELFPQHQRKLDPMGSNLTLPVSPDATGLFLDIHSWGNVMFWPWVFEEIESPNNLQLQTLAMKFESYNGYHPSGAGSVNWWYAASGSAQDWAYGRLGVAALTFEIGTDFYEDCEYFEENIMDKMLPALVYGAKVAQFPYKTPLGPDIISVAKPMRNGIDTPRVSLNSRLTLRVCASDEARISNGDENYVETGNQDVIGVDVYLDIHPSNETATESRMSMKPSDGLFNSVSEVAELEIDLSKFSIGRHTLYFQATDSDGFIGPITSRYFEVCAPSTSGCSGVESSEIDDC